MAQLCTLYKSITILAILLALSLFCTGLAQLVIGGVYYGKCPFRAFLIGYNITSGVVTVASFVFFGVIAATLFHNEGVHWISGVVIIVFTIIAIIITLFIFSWTIVGSTVTVWQRNYTTINQTLSSYCHPTLALSSFVLVILYAIAFYLLLIVLCLLKVCQDR
jgi:hypothetical protein